MELKIAFEFIESINNANIEKISELISADHSFIDSQGNRLKGKQKIVKAWKSYFQLFPDYKIEAIESFQNVDEIVLLGHASGTYIGDGTHQNDNHWKIPAAWKAIVKNNKVELWQVYADNSVVIDIISKTKHLSNM